MINYPVSECTHGTTQPDEAWYQVADETKTAQDKSKGQQFGLFSNVTGKENCESIQKEETKGNNAINRNHWWYFCANHTGLREFTLWSEQKRMYFENKRAQDSQDVAFKNEKGENYLRMLGGSLFSLRKLEQKEIEAPKEKIESPKARRSVKKVKRLKWKVRKLKKNCQKEASFRRPSIREMSFHLSEIEKGIDDTKRASLSELANNLSSIGSIQKSNLKRFRLSTLGCGDDYKNINQRMLDKVSEKSISLTSEDNEEREKWYFRTNNGANQKEFDSESGSDIIKNPNVGNEWKSSKHINFDELLNIDNELDKSNDDGIEEDYHKITHQARVKSLPKRQKQIKKIKISKPHEDISEIKKREKQQTCGKITIPDLEFQNLKNAYEWHSFTQNKQLSPEMKFTFHSNSNYDTESSPLNNKISSKSDQINSWCLVKKSKKKSSFSKAAKKKGSNCLSSTGQGSGSFKITPMPTESMKNIINNLKDLEDYI